MKEPEVCQYTDVTPCCKDCGKAAVGVHTCTPYNPRMAYRGRKIAKDPQTGLEYELMPSGAVYSIDKRGTRRRVSGALAQAILGDWIESSNKASTGSVGG